MQSVGGEGQATGGASNEATSNGATPTGTSVTDATTGSTTPGNTTSSSVPSGANGGPSEGETQAPSGAQGTGAAGGDVSPNMGGGSSASVDDEAAKDGAGLGGTDGSDLDVAPVTMGEPSAGDDAPAEGDGMSEVDEAGEADSMGEPDTTDEPDTTEEPAGPDAATFGPDVEGTCTESQPANSNASGSGPYDVVVETNSDPGINEGTIYRPADLSSGEAFPIFAWGEGGCSQNGLSNSAAMAEIASHGYFVVADGTPNGSGSRDMDSNNIASMGEPLLAYIDWAIAENSKPCSAYYHSLDQSKVAANGFSCGGLMSTGTAGDPRMTTWGSTSSGTFSVNQAFYESVHTPVLIVEGGPSDIAYEIGLRDYDNLSALGTPIAFFSKDIGHGGDLFQGGNGDFTKINLAWLNWWLKGDEGETGKGLLVGPGCPYCSDSEWEVMSANLP